MADEKTRDQNQPNQGNEDRGKALGAAAGVGNPQENENQANSDNPKQNEFAGQGGGIQGSGQRQANPGGFTEQGGPGAQNAPRDNQQSNQSSAEGREQAQGE